MKTSESYHGHGLLVLIAVYLSPILFWISTGIADQLAPTLNHVAYGNGTFIAVGGNGTILTSPDGAEWTQRASGTDCTLMGVAFGKGIFVAVGGGITSSGSKITILSSSDGIMWQESYSKILPYSDASFSAVTYGNDMFVAVGDGGRVITSTDGEIWTEISLGPCGDDLNGIAYGNGIFVAVGSICEVTNYGRRCDGLIQTSHDGITWTCRDWSGGFGHVAYADGVLIIPGDPICLSVEGVTWECARSWVAPGVSSVGLGSIAYGNGMFVGLGRGNYNWCPGIYTSPDGKLWTQRMEATHSMLGVTYANGIFVAVGDESTILTSSDGLSWPDLPWVSVSPGGFDFGNVEVFSKSAPQVFTFTNTGKTSFVFDMVSLQLSDTSEFYIQSDTCSLHAIAPSESCTIGVVFSPTSADYKQAELEIPYGNCPIFVLLRGIGVAASTISILSPPAGTYLTACSLKSPPTFSWNVLEAFTDYELQFGDYHFDQIYVHINVQAPDTQVTLSTGLMKQFLMLSTAIYWRVIGTRADGTKVMSADRYVFIYYCRPAGNPAISPTGKRSKPILTWQNNCNTKFKVWFGNDSSFTKKTTFTYNIKDPTEEVFSKPLTLGQWMTIKRLVKNVTGSTIYWYVESWDGLGRYEKTGVMNFVLTD